MKQVLLATTILFAVAPTSSGTLGMMLGTQQDITVAIDSRRHLHNPERYSDKACKLIALDDRLLFFAVNVASGSNWSAQADARKAWINGLTNNGNADIKVLASRWGDLLKKDLRSEFLHTSHREITPGILTIGFFALRLASLISTATAEVIYDGSTLTVQVNRDPEWSGIRLVTKGEADVADRFGSAFLGVRPINDDRYRVWESSTKEALMKAPLDLRAATFLKKLGAITSELTASATPIGSPVNGPYDIAELSVAHGVHWIERKSNCPAI